MRIERMELLGVVVDDVDEAVAAYSERFGLEFHIFTPGVDCALVTLEAGEDPSPPRPAGGRLAMDTSGCFELVEVSGTTPGVRNIHFRVDDMDAAKAHLAATGLRVVADLDGRHGARGDLRLSGRRRRAVLPGAVRGSVVRRCPPRLAQTVSSAAPRGSSVPAPCGKVTTWQRGGRTSEGGARCPATRR